MTFQFPSLYMTKYDYFKEFPDCTYEEDVYFDFGVAINSTEARQKFPPVGPKGRKMFRNPKIKVVPISWIDDHFISALRVEELKSFLEENPNVKQAKEVFSKRVCFVKYWPDQDHHGVPVGKDIDIFISSSPHKVPMRVPYIEPGYPEYPSKYINVDDSHRGIIENGTVKVENWELVPCIVKDYNAKALDPNKALQRWQKRNKLEEESHHGSSLRKQLRESYRKISHKKKEALADTTFVTLDLGCGPLANTWIIVVKEKLVPPENMHTLDIDVPSLLAGSCLYGSKLAKCGFDWTTQVKQGSAYTMPYPDEMFDFIMLFNSFENIINAYDRCTLGKAYREYPNSTPKSSHRYEAGKKLFKELTRILKNSGKIYLSTFASDSEIHSHCWHFSAKELSSFVEGSGLVMGIPSYYTWPHSDGRKDKMLSAVFTKENPV
jgi:SAM-dependent methyltransferase